LTFLRLPLVLLLVAAACGDSSTTPPTTPPTTPSTPPTPTPPPPPPASVATVELAPASATIIVGETSTFTATLRDANSNTLAGRTVAWSSSASTIASVSQSGVVTAVAAGGPVTITATSEGRTGTAQVTAKGLNAPQAPQNLSYTAPSADGDVEVRNQRGQVLQAPTDAARQAAPQVSAAFGGPAAAAPTRRAPQGQPQNGQGQGGAQATGAFGQKQAPQSAGPAPVNRAQRRAQEKRNKGR
jgi:hypothetical protein